MQRRNVAIGKSENSKNKNQKERKDSSSIRNSITNPYFTFEMKPTDETNYIEKEFENKSSTHVHGASCNHHHEHKETSEQHKQTEQLGNDDKDPDTFYLEKPAFCRSLLGSAEETPRLPKFEAFSPQHKRYVQVEEKTGAFICNNGIKLYYPFIEGHGVLSRTTFLSRMAECMHFYEKMPSQFVSHFNKIQEQIENRRKNLSFCSFLDFLKILKVFGVFSEDIVVKPRLEFLIDFIVMEKERNNANVANYCDVDLNKISNQTYISLTIAILAKIFAGGERLLVINNEMFHETAVTLYGHEFWRFVHYCIPNFNFKFRSLFSSQFIQGPKTNAPHMYQYLSAEAMVRIIWIAFGQAIRITTKKIAEKLVSTYSEENKNNTMKVEINRHLKRDTSHDVTRKEYYEYCNFISYAFLAKEEPSALRGYSIEDFEKIAATFGLSATMLYIAKSAVEMEVLEIKKNQVV